MQNQSEEIEYTDNSKLIYEHAEKSVQGINKSIDNITSKLTTLLGFSGVLLKFASDMPSDGVLFSFKVCVTILLLAAILFCACGLYPKGAGESVTTSHLRYVMYYEPEEEVRRLIIDQEIVSIDQLKELAKFRRGYLYWAMLSLMTAAVVFGFSIIVKAIPQSC